MGNRGLRLAVGGLRLAAGGLQLAVAHPLPAAGWWLYRTASFGLAAAVLPADRRIIVSNG